MRNDLHESRLLLAILRQRWEEVEAICRASPPDASTFVSLARECDIHPYVHARLESQGCLHLLDEEAVKKLRELRRKCQADNLLLLARLEEALDLLIQAGIVPVALKGVDVLHRFDLGFDERSLDDVDLLVRPEEFTKSLAALEAGGWTGPGEPERTHFLRSSYALPLASPGPLEVAFEIHWSLDQEYRYRPNMEEVFRRTVPLNVAGRSIQRLEDHDAVAHLLLHHLHHYFDRRLKWALDLGRLVHQAGFRWDVVATRLASWGGRAAAGMALVHLRKLFPDLIPPEATGALPAATWRRLLTWPLRSSHPLDLFRWTRQRRIQLYLAAVLLENPAALPGYLIHRTVRDRRAGPPFLD